LEGAAALSAHRAAAGRLALSRAYSLGDNGAAGSSAGRFFACRTRRPRKDIAQETRKIHDNKGANFTRESGATRRLFYSDLTGTPYHARTTREAPMTDLASTLVHDNDSSEYAFMTVIAIGIATLLAGVVSIIPPHYAAAAADVPSLAQFYL
jgi:hypothetical protein